MLLFISSIVLNIITILTVLISIVIIYKLNLISMAEDANDASAIMSDLHTPLDVYTHLPGSNLKVGDIGTFRGTLSEYSQVPSAL